MLVGDLDSISASGRMWAYAHELLIDEHPEAKDETDTELALAAAAAMADAQHLLLLGGIDLEGVDRQQLSTCPFVRQLLAQRYSRLLLPRH